MCIRDRYYDFSQPVSKIANHRVLAVDRGEKEEFLSVKIEVDAQAIKEKLNQKLVSKDVYKRQAGNRRHGPGKRRLKIPARYAFGQWMRGQNRSASAG